MTTCLEIRGIIDRDDGQDMAQEDQDKIIDGMVEFLEANGYGVFATCGIVDENGDPVSVTGQHPTA